MDSMFSVQVFFIRVSKRVFKLSKVIQQVLWIDYWLIFSCFSFLESYFLHHLPILEKLAWVIWRDMWIILQRWVTYMDLLMGPKISTLWKRSLTCLTLIWFFSCVSPHMNFQSACSHKLVSTHLTWKRSLTWMPSFMIIQMSLRGKTLFTVCKITSERLLPIMNPHVS